MSTICKHYIVQLFLCNHDFLQVFREAIKLGVGYKENSTDFMDEVLKELEVC